LTTMDFKQKFITALVAKYKPTQIEIFDDRERHVTRLRDFALKSFEAIPSKVHHIVEDGQETILPRHIELDLIAKLALKVGKPFDLSERIEYAGVMLDDTSSALLLEKFPAKAGWTKYAHHMTVCLGPLFRANLDGITVKDLGKPYKLKVEAIGESERALAVKVSGTQVFELIVF